MVCAKFSSGQSLFDDLPYIHFTSCPLRCNQPNQIEAYIMKLAVFTLALVMPMLALADGTRDKSLVYINKNIGFNVPGYNYTQSEYPCDIDQVLVKNLIKKADKNGIQLEPVSTLDKINNGTVPVLAIDIEQLVLGDKKFGTKQESTLPKVQITAALIKGKGDMVTAKHTCAIATLYELNPNSNVMDLSGPTVCSATRKCLKDLSKDVIEWIEPQI
jgi:hypothetical protein